MKKILLAILTCAAATVASANSVDNCAVTLDTGLLLDLLPTIETQQYWGSSDYAAYAATEAGSCGFPNSYQSPNDEGPLFLFSYVTLPDDEGLQFAGWVYFEGDVHPLTINSSYTESVAILTDVPDATATMPLAAVGLVSLAALRRKIAT